MARVRLSYPAQSDLSHILATSTERWGIEARRRYAALIAAAMRKAAADPNGPATRNRSEALSGVRSLHLRHAGADSPRDKVGAPVHIIYYRIAGPDLIEIVRVLHERMEPSQHLDPGSSSRE